MSKAHVTLSAAALNRGVEHPTLGKDNLLSLFESAVCPAALVSSLWALAYYFEGSVLPAYLLLAVLTFALTF